jgi:hypothetical protein
MMEMMYSQSKFNYENDHEGFTYDTTATSRLAYLEYSDNLRYGDG